MQNKLQRDFRYRKLFIEGIICIVIVGFSEQLHDGSDLRNCVSRGKVSKEGILQGGLMKWVRKGEEGGRVNEIGERE